MEPTKSASANATPPPLPSIAAPPPIPTAAAWTLPPLPPARVAAVGSNSTTRTLLIAAASLSALFLGLLTLILLGFSTGVVGLLGGIVLALLPLPFYLLLALWIDRFEKEPVWMLVAAFLWGATVAVFVAFILNTVFEAIVAGSFEAYASVMTATISAPLIEETAKGVALLIFYLWQRDEFDNVLDGILYAAMVGLGFAMTENILYYGKAIAGVESGGPVGIFIMRGIIAPFSHPFFTSMTGIGFGLARQANSGSPIKFLAPAGGLCLAMGLHCLWNLSASFGAVFFLVYALVMFPAFLGLLGLIAFSLRKEGRILRQYLTTELQSGLFDPKSYEALCTVRGRWSESCRALGRGGYSNWRTRQQYHALVSELAFHRWRTSRGILPRAMTPAAREVAYLQRLHDLKSRLG